MRYTHELPDDAPVIDRLHWYAANYAVLKERAAMWDTRTSRLVARIEQLQERNEELVEEAGVLREENKRVWAALLKAGLTADDGENADGR